MDIKESVFIIDGSSFLYRAYYSIRPLTTKSGIPVNAVFGFIRMIKKLLDTYSPKYMVVVWDSKGKTVRHEMYEQYKQSRQAAPNDLMQQKEIIQEFCEIIGLKQLFKPGIEADDLMYSLVEELKLEKINSVLVTSDKDMGQALSENCQILDPFKDAFITTQSLEEKLQFSIAKLPFYYALVGDSSDNIPGVRGIGPKGAQQLVIQFSSLEDLYNNLDKVASERVRLLLENSKADAYLSQELFKLRFYETYTSKEGCIFAIENWDKAIPLFEKLEFKSLLKKEEVKTQRQIESLARKYKFILVDTIEKLNAVCNEIKEYGYFALDTEGTSLDPLSGEMVGLSICVNEGTAYYVAFGHKTNEQQLAKSEAFSLLKPIFEDIKIKKYLHHYKFDALMLWHEGIELKGTAFDTIIAASLLVGDGQRIGLKYLSEYYLNEPMLHFEDIVKGNKYKDFSYVPLALATEYAAADAHQTMKLYHLYKNGIKEQGLSHLFDNLEMPFADVLVKMEKKGIILDDSVLKNIDITVTEEISKLHTQIIDLIGHNFADINLNSPKQLEDLLFNHLKLPAVKKTAQKTSYSTDQRVLRDLSKLHPVPALIMRYREMFKLKSTYLDSLGHYINKETGRIHTTFNQTSVATGRLASSDPNLQNIPVDRFKLRSAFKAEEGKLFLSADYSQIELRVLAYLSQDATLLNAFKEGKDIHALTAAGLFDVSVDNVTPEQRQIGKRINFSILYGLTAHGLAQDLEISHSVAKSYIEKFMAQYPQVQNWMEATVNKTKELGYIETAWGRRRYLPGIYERNRTLYDLARRVAINTVCQGTAAEIMKWGMLKLDNVLRDNDKKADILLQIHDELLIEVSEADILEITELTKNVLQNVVQWNVPLIVTTRIGKDWQEVTK